MSLFHAPSSRGGVRLLDGAELPRPEAPAAGKLDRCALLVDALSRLSPPLELNFAGQTLRLSAPALGRGLLSLGQQLRGGARTARVLLGESVLALEATGEAQTCIARLLPVTAQPPAPDRAFTLSWRALLAEGSALWQAWDARVAEVLASPLLDPALLAGWRAQTADLALLAELAKPPEPPAWKPRPQELASADFNSLFQLLTGQVFPFAELLASGQVSGPCLYAGPAPEPDLELPQRLLSWLQAAGEAPAWFICFEDQRLIWVEKGHVSAYFEDFAGPAGARAAWTPAPLLQQLSFFAKYRGHFRDGLNLLYGELAPRHEPIAADKIKRLNQVVLLEALDTPERIRIEPHASLSVGRDSSCDVQIDDPLLGRRQAVFHNRLGVCTVEDAGSPSGIWLNDAFVSEPAPLHEGDRLRLGGRVYAVRFPAPAHH